MSTPDGYDRVRRDKVCPICGKPDWCLIHREGKSAICARVEGKYPRSEAGYYHRLTDAPCRTQATRHVPLIQVDFSDKAQAYASNMNAARYGEISKALGVSPESLRRLRTGWDGRAFTFPMRDGKGAVIGIRRRFRNGKKVSVKGSKNGLFIPDALTGEGVLYICEGASDAAAAIDLGIGDVIGRPSCNARCDLVIALVKRAAYKAAVIIPDNDCKPNGLNPGLDGGYRIARKLRPYIRRVYLAIPPPGLDLREWINKNGLNGVKAELEYCEGCTA